ncbi:hypothetical protein [Ideonella sp.]|uniref:hypothetical protein n=1 Tax=Ideonella sp. TaxID=1929293 RepID=UPI002B46B7B9|nr:hypothetical protein [Ideonella sp.]HJV71828.1 hypothetical protein [Ideonella sp.]
MRRAPLALATLASLALLAGCDLLGIEGASALAERRAAEGKAIGAACRNAARAIEDCYTLNKKSDKAAIYAGWREMDDYMRENKLEPVPPQLGPEPARTAKADGESADEQVAAADGKPDAKADGKPARNKKAGAH